jgi:hypothetical protein
VPQSPVDPARPEVELDSVARRRDAIRHTRQQHPHHACLQAALRIISEACWLTGGVITLNPRQQAAPWHIEFSQACPPDGESDLSHHSTAQHVIDVLLKRMGIVIVHTHARDEHGRVVCTINAVSDHKQSP